MPGRALADIFFVLFFVFFDFFVVKKLSQRLWVDDGLEQSHARTMATDSDCIFEELSFRVIGCAIEVHTQLGPGLLESTYEQCLAHELALQGLAFKVQAPLPVHYKGLQLDCGYRVDVLVDEALIVELKSVDKLVGIHRAQLLTYMKLSKVGIGLLINFNVRKLREGIERYVT